MRSGALTRILILLSIISLVLLTNVNAPFVSAEDETYITRGSRITISITLLQNGTYGDPVVDQTVEFYDQSYNILLGTNHTNMLGLASFQWTIPPLHPLGPTIINATYRGNASLFLLPAYQTIAVHIVASTNLAISIDEYLVAPSDTIEIEVTLNDDTALPLSGATIHIMKENTTLISKLTNTSGQVRFNLECNTTWLALGTNFIDIVFLTDTSRYLEGSVRRITIEMNQIEPTMSTFVSGISFFLGESVEINLTLSSAEGIMPYAPVSVWLGEQLLLDIATDANGNCSFQILLNHDFYLGINTVRIEYLGSTRYAPTQTIIPLSIHTTLHVTVSPLDTAFAGEPLAIQIAATDSLNRSIPQFSLNMTDLTTGLGAIVAFPSNTATVVHFLQIGGPPGTHLMYFEAVNNDYISNGSMSINLAVWSRPQIILTSGNINHFAFPGQSILLELQVSDWQGNLSHHQIDVILDGVYLQTFITDDHGIIIFNSNAPVSESSHNISFFVTGSIMNFQASSQYDYIFEVTRIMPVMLDLRAYEIVSPLKKIHVQVEVRGLNGTLLGGIDACFHWQGSILNKTSLPNGQIVLDLSIPSIEGIHVLTYYLAATWSMNSTSGSFNLEIANLDILASQGLGIHILAFSLVGSLALVLIPAIAKRTLML